MTDSSTHPTTPAELVERLAREAGADAWDVYRSPPGNLMISVDGIDIEPEIQALVQLVARECADLRIFPAINTYPASNVAELKAYRAGMEHLRGAIRERFGVMK